MVSFCQCYIAIIKNFKMECDDMKKTCIVLIFCIIMSTLVSVASFAEDKDAAGYAKYVDVSAYINHYPINVFGINGYAVVAADDLRHYGFDVTFDSAAGTLSVTRDSALTEILPYGTVYKYSQIAGTTYAPYTESDIKTYVDGNLVESFDVEGKIYIYFRSLKPYGEVVWDSESGTSKLWIEGLPAKEYIPLEDAPVTKLYSLDGRTLVVENSEVEIYTHLGWYENQKDVMTTLVSKDKRSIDVYKSQVEDYMACGWLLRQESVIDPAKPMVALTFDDGPNPTSTGRVLDTLQLHNARATFFVLGSLAEKYPDVLVRMNEIGCQIGNHTYDHPELIRISNYKIANQITRTSEIISNATGVKPTLTRPPYGSYNKTVSSCAQTPIILWSIDTLDWKNRNATVVTDSVMSKVKDGDIILLHDIHDTTATATEDIVPALIERGFQLVTIDELAYYKNKTLLPGVAYSRIK